MVFCSVQELKNFKNVKNKSEDGCKNAGQAIDTGNFYCLFDEITK